MCDTVGYIPRSAAGKEIRCANRECMVPVFIARRPEKKQEEEAAPAKKLTPKNLLMAAMAVGLIAFAVGFFIKNQPPEITKNPQPEEFHPKSVVAKDKGDEPAPVAVVVEKPITLGEERKPALTLMARAAEDKSHNRSRALCDRLTAHTAAECGDLETAGKFLEMLEHAENGLTFYRVPPLTSLAWRDLTGGRHEAPRASPGGPLDEATRAAADLPVEGAFSLDAAAWLAAALTVAGRDGPARALVAKFPASGSPGRLAAAEARAEAWNTCDVDRADQNRLLVDGLSLQLPLVVELVVARGFPSAALHLAESTPDESLRTECEVAWLEAVQRAGSANVKPAPGQDPPPPDSILARLKPATQARCHARFGLLHLADNDQKGAEAELKAAVAALGSAKAEHEFELPMVKEIYEWQPSDPGPARQNALACAEIARLQAGLGHAADAHRSLATSLEFMRASAPSLIAVESKQRVSMDDRAGLRSQLQKAARLRDNQVDAALNQYIRNLGALGQVADARFKLESEILDAALAWSDPNEVWKLIRKQMTSGDPDRQEPFLRTPLPWQLAFGLERRGQERDKRTYDEIRKVVGATPVPSLARLDDVVSKANDAEPNQLIDDLRGITDVDRSDLQRADFIIADRRVKKGEFAKGFEFARKLEDPNLREETMEWTAALACRLGQGRKVKDALLEANASFLPTQLVAAWRGFLIGLLARERAEPAAASAAPTAAPPAAAKTPSGEESKHAEASKG